MKKRKHENLTDFAAACGRLRDAVTEVAFHPQCPALVKHELMTAVYEMADHAAGLGDARAKFDVHYLFDALANSQFAE